MLRKETTTPDMIRLIIELQSSKVLNDFILAGGTALSLQLGHRKSNDIDMFSINKHDYNEIHKYIHNNYNNVDTIYNDETSLQLYINKIKVDMVSIKGNILETPIKDDGIVLYGLKDISAMKLLSIQGRKEPKDYVDIAYLIETIGLENMIKCYKEKYDKSDTIDVKKALASTGQVNPFKWENISMIRDDIPLSMVKRVIDDALFDYEKYNEKYIKHNIFSNIMNKRRK